MSRIITLRSILLVSVSIFCFCLTSFAQAVGEVKGLIVDQQNARIAKGKILVKGKGFKKEFATDDSGEYTIKLPAGKYKISAKMDGFYQSKWKSLQVKGNQPAKLDFNLVGIRVDSEHP